MPNPTISTITVGGTTYDIVGGSGYVPHVVVVTDTGSTVTITKGQTTYTATETSTGVFEADITSVNDYGTYTITGSLNGVTTTTTLDIDTVKVYEVDLSPRISVTLTIYSAKEDTISYVDIDGATQTITFASGESSKQVTIEIEASGSSITFTSGVAKDPSDLTADYSKTVTITSNTTEVYLMPDGALYWWGYEKSEFSGQFTKSTNYLYSNGSNNYYNETAQNIDYTGRTSAYTIANYDNDSTLYKDDANTLANYPTGTTSINLFWYDGSSHTYNQYGLRETTSSNAFSLQRRDRKYFPKIYAIVLT